MASRKPGSQPGSKWLWFHRFGSPEYVYDFAGKWSPWAAAVSAILFAIGLYLGLAVAPSDYQMGDSYRIIFIHVPTAWMSMFTYVVMATAAACGLIWKMKMGYAVARACAPLGAAFTFCALLTGSLWGKPTWGTYWIWDARLTSELVLLFLYFGIIALDSALEDRQTASQATAVLALVGIVNIPIIHFSVEWWNTLHQGATVAKFDKPSMDTAMLIPLLVMATSFKFYYLIAMFQQARTELLMRERNSQWVAALLEKT